MLATSWFDWLGRVDQAVWLTAVPCFSVAAVVVTAFIVHGWRRVRQSESRTALVGMMLQRGMSAADIERVMQACSDSAGEDYEDEPDVRIVALMKENEYEGDDIERILDVARVNGRIDVAAVRVVETLVEQGAKVGEIEGILEARRTHPAPKIAV